MSKLVTKGDYDGDDNNHDEEVVDEGKEVDDNDNRYQSTTSPRCYSRLLTRYCKQSLSKRVIIMTNLWWKHWNCLFWKNY